MSSNNNNNRSYPPNRNETNPRARQLPSDSRIKYNSDSLRRGNRPEKSQPQAQAQQSQAHHQAQHALNPHQAQHAQQLRQANALPNKPKVRRETTQPDKNNPLTFRFDSPWLTGAYSKDNIPKDTPKLTVDDVKSLIPKIMKGFRCNVPYAYHHKIEHASLSRPTEFVRKMPKPSITYLKKESWPVFNKYIGQKLDRKCLKRICHRAADPDYVVPPATRESIALSTCEPGEIVNEKYEEKKPMRPDPFEDIPEFDDYINKIKNDAKKKSLKQSIARPSRPIEKPLSLTRSADSFGDGPSAKRQAITGSSRQSTMYADFYGHAKSNVGSSASSFSRPIAVPSKNAAGSSGSSGVGPSSSGPSRPVTGSSGVIRPSITPSGPSRPLPRKSNVPAESTSSSGTFKVPERVNRARILSEDGQSRLLESRSAKPPTAPRVSKTLDMSPATVQSTTNYDDFSKWQVLTDVFLFEAEMKNHANLSVTDVDMSRVNEDGFGRPILFSVEDNPTYDLIGLAKSHNIDTPKKPAMKAKKTLPIKADTPTPAPKYAGKKPMDMKTFEEIMNKRRQVDDSLTDDSNLDDDNDKESIGTDIVDSDSMDTDTMDEDDDDSHASERKASGSKFDQKPLTNTNASSKRPTTGGKGLMAGKRPMISGKRLMNAGKSPIFEKRPMSEQRSIAEEQASSSDRKSADRAAAEQKPYTQRKQVAPEQKVRGELKSATDEKKQYVEKDLTASSEKFSERKQVLAEKKSLSERKSGSNEKKQAVEKDLAAHEPKSSSERKLSTSELKAHTDKKVLPSDKKPYAEKEPSERKVGEKKEGSSASEKKPSAERVLPSVERRSYSEKGLPSAERKPYVEKGSSSVERRSYAEKGLPAKKSFAAVEKEPVASEKLSGETKPVGAEKKPAVSKKTMEPKPMASHKVPTSNSSREDGERSPSPLPESQKPEYGKKEKADSQQSGSKSLKRKQEDDVEEGRTPKKANVQLSATNSKSNTLEQYKVFTFMFKSLAHTYKKRGDKESDPFKSTLDHFHSFLNYVISLYYAEQQDQNLPPTQMSATWKTIIPLADTVLARLKTHNQPVLAGACLRLLSMMRFHIFDRMQRSLSMSSTLMEEYRKAINAFSTSEANFSFHMVAASFPVTFKETCIHGDVMRGIVVGGEAGTVFHPCFPFSLNDNILHAALVTKCFLNEVVQVSCSSYREIKNTDEYM